MESSNRVLDGFSKMTVVYDSETSRSVPVDPSAGFVFFLIKAIPRRGKLVFAKSGSYSNASSNSTPG